MALGFRLLALGPVRNKRIVERLQRQGRNAVGLTGLDGRAVAGTGNTGIRVREGDKTPAVTGNGPRRSPRGR